MNDIETLKHHVEAAAADYAKFQAGNKAAGTRARKSLMEVKKLAGEMRISIGAQKAGVK